MCDIGVVQVTALSSDLNLHAGANDPYSLDLGGFAPYDVSLDLCAAHHRELRRDADWETERKSPIRTATEHPIKERRIRPEADCESRDLKPVRVLTKLRMYPCTLVGEPLTAFVTVRVNEESVFVVRGIIIKFHPAKCVTGGKQDAVYRLSNRRCSIDDAMLHITWSLGKAQRQIEISPNRAQCEVQSKMQ